MLNDGWPTARRVAVVDVQLANKSDAVVTRTMLRPTPRVLVMCRLMKRIFRTRLRVHQC